MPPPSLGCVVEEIAVKQEGSIVANQKDNCADVAAKSQSSDYPSLDSVYATIAKGLVNVLAFAAASEINFKEAKTMKTALAEIKSMLAKNERGHDSRHGRTVHSLQHHSLLMSTMFTR